VDALLEFGPSAPGMAGPVPVSFSEIEAWARVTGTDLPGHEATILRSLSRDYCAQFSASKDPKEPMPLMPGEHHRAAVARGFADLMKQHRADK
jgi:hypothetical protein